MRFLWYFFIGLGMVIPLVLFAQSDEELINKILMAAPERLRADAAVIGWQDDGTRMTIRSGSNGVVCWDQSDEPRKRTYSSRCTSEANLPRVEQNRSWLTSGQSQDEIQKIMNDAEENGSREISEFGTVYYSVNTDDPDNANIHITISVPHATSESLGVPSERTNSNVWIMGAGTSGAHLMIPGR
tara:strand:- start:5823 stop:6377 length:555 start_codon:yes stop_codon:yes gene_type:complete